MFRAFTVCLWAVTDFSKIQDLYMIYSLKIQQLHCVSFYNKGYRTLEIVNCAICSNENEMTI